MEMGHFVSVQQLLFGGGGDEVIQSALRRAGFQPMLSFFMSMLVISLSIMIFLQACIYVDACQINPERGQY